ncbi:MAG: hypothetical protein ABR540_05110 [Acidimicrobiales bacterium]|nr:hypothetical protein [Actinomycetota bacterium]
MPEGSDPTDLPSHAQDLWQLVVGYVKQETVEPIKGVGRFIALGLAGSALVGLGLVVLFLGVLRLLQEETGDAFSGHLSFVPYLITLVACGAVAGAAVKALSRKKEAT